VTPEAVLSSLALLSSHADEQVRLIAGEAARVIREREWRDIASAPKDGTEILVTGGTFTTTDGENPDWPLNFITKTHWHRTYGRWDGGMTSDGYTEFVYSPTHWQPLPAPAEG
jgi:hypothetical protein